MKNTLECQAHNEVFSMVRNNNVEYLTRYMTEFARRCFAKTSFCAPKNILPGVRAVPFDYAVYVPNVIKVTSISRSRKS